jgi:hypothetical protein
MHEAGHAVALLASGYGVQSVIVKGDTGQCTPVSQPCPRVLAIAAAAGALAEAMEGGDVGRASGADERHFIASGGTADSVREATRILSRHAAAVFLLAAELDKRGRLDREDFRRLCSQPALKFAAGHYPAPRTTKRLRSLGVQSVGASVSLFG